MKLMFFGTGEFGIPTLEKLLESDHKVIAVVTQPDRQKGRGWKVQPAPVKAFLKEKGVRVELFQPGKVSDMALGNKLRSKRADVFVVVDYGMFLSQPLLNAPNKFCINLHPSLLPKYRGAAPVNWAILNGEKETGNTVIRLSGRMDAGSIILQERIYIGDGENAIELADRLSKSGADLVLKALELIEENIVEFKEQEESEASFAPGLEKEQGRINWKESAFEIGRKIRALQPWPGTFTHFGGKILKVIKAQVVMNIEDNKTPGSICDESKFIVATGKGALQMEEVQI
ncbi:MAG: methionyl-tRNA formyltransferase, partial [Candidatus Omnitrophota bacterium]